MGFAAIGIGAGAEIQPSEDSENPFFSDWQSPHGIPDFGRIKDEHFFPAFEAGVEQLGSEIAAIRDNPDPPTFTNTVEALESAGALLDRVKNVFRNLGNTNASDFHNELDGKVTALLADRRVPVYLDETLYQRVKTVYEQKQLLGLDEQALRLLELKYRGFPDRESAWAQRTRIVSGPSTRASAELSSAFEQNLLAETKGFKLLVTEPQDLAGIPALSVESARAFAQAQGYPEGWLFGLNRSRFENFMSYSENRDLRRQMYQAYTRRAGSGSRDNREILLEIVRLRAERAESAGL